jgi:hypothetical protein
LSDIHTVLTDVDNFSDNDLHLSAVETEVATYLAGYLCQKVLSSFDRCYQTVISETPTGHFVAEKQFDFIRKVLCYPTKEFTKVVDEMECRFRKVIVTECHKENIMKSMKAAIRTTSVKLFDVLSDHNVAHQIVLLDRFETAFVTVRLHHLAKVENAKFRQSCRQKGLQKWARLGVELQFVFTILFHTFVYKNL